MARHRGGVDRGLQIQRRDRHAEIDARAAFDGAVHRGEIRQVALHDLSAEPAQGVGALVLPPDQGAHLVALGEQHCGEVAADGAGRSGHEDRAVGCGFHHHIAGLKLRSESNRCVRSFIGRITGPRRSAPWDLLHSLTGRVAASLRRFRPLTKNRIGSVASLKPTFVIPLRRAGDFASRLPSLHGSVERSTIRV